MFRYIFHITTMLRIISHILFGNQFTPDEVYDGYPSDRLMVDIPVALMAVQTATTQVLSEFPMKPAATETGTMETKETPTNP